MTEIKDITGNIFSTKHQTLVNTVNCFGVMGAGIALEFKYRYPDMFKKYVDYCEKQYIQIGKLWIYEIPNSNKKILNFPTKHHWKYETKPEYIHKGLQKFVETYKEKNITSIAFPVLGALNGGLEKEQSLEIMHQYLSKCDIPIEIYQYNPQAKDELIDTLRDLITYETIEKLIKITGFKKSDIQKIKKVFENNDDIYTVSQLGKVKGIGDETVTKWFQFIIKYQNKNENQTIQAKIQIHDLFASTNTVKSKIEVSINQQNQYIVNIIDKAKQTPIYEKQKITGLDEITINKIETNKFSATLQDIITYCQKLKIPYTDFIPELYITT